MNKNSRKKHPVISILIILALTLVVFFVSVTLGGIKVTPYELFRGLFIEYNENVAIIYDLRFPRIFIALIGGAAIAVSGVLFQAVVKNPLADPSILGISSGASLASMLVTAFAPALLSFLPFFSFLGGYIAFCLVYSLSYKKGIHPLRLILVGVAVNAVAGGFIDVISTTMSSSSAGQTITLKTWSDVKMLAIVTVIGLVLAFVCASYCNILALEDKTVQSLGINIHHIRIAISIVAVMLVSMATAIIGVITFLGLIVPHMARIFVGSNHKVLIPFSAILGAFVLLLADTLGRTIMAPYEISASVIMAIVGGPMFILLLRKQQVGRG